ncbi:MAG: hypothetical protein KF865_02230 [Bdellovibrionaceae bacterium]|nr:hypothetical protein [Pseudobdellovibrionaceae bacterium]
MKNLTGRILLWSLVMTGVVACAEKKSDRPAVNASPTQDEVNRKEPSTKDAKAALETRQEPTFEVGDVLPPPVLREELKKAVDPKDETRTADSAPASAGVGAGAKSEETAAARDEGGEDAPAAADLERRVFVFFRQARNLIARHHVGLDAMARGDFQEQFNKLSLAMEEPVFRALSEALTLEAGHLNDIHREILNNKDVALQVLQARHNQAVMSFLLLAIPQTNGNERFDAALNAKLPSFLNPGFAWSFDFNRETLYDDAKARQMIRSLKTALETRQLLERAQTAPLIDSKVRIFLKKIKVVPLKKYEGPRAAQFAELATLIYRVRHGAR